MRNMLALFAAALLTVAGLGWYLGWYKLRSQPAAVPGQRSVSIDFNTSKIGTDLHKGEQKLQAIIESTKEQATEQAKDQAKTAESGAKKAADDKGLSLPVKVHFKPLIQFGSSDKQ